MNFLRSLIVKNKPPELSSFEYLLRLKASFYSYIMNKTSDKKLPMSIYREINIVQQALFEARFILLD